MRWEIRRLCRGGSKSLTNTGIHRDGSPLYCSFDHGFPSTASPIGSESGSESGSQPKSGIANSWQTGNDTDCDLDSDPDPDNDVLAASSGSQIKATGFVGGYLLSAQPINLAMIGKLFH